MSKKKIIAIVTIVTSILLFTTINNNKKYKVNVDSVNGSSNIVVKLKKNEHISEKYNPTREGYIFIDWYIDPTYKVIYNPKAHNKKKNLIVYAKWEKEQTNTNYNEEEIINILEKAINNHYTNKSFKVETNGILDAGISKQEIYGIKAQKNNLLYLYSSSIGMVDTFTQLQSINNNDFNYQKGTADKNFKPKTLSEELTLSLDEYKNQYGIGPKDISFIINKNTILKIDNIVIGSNIYFTVELDPILSTKNYQKNIQATNSFKSKLPVFQSVKLDVVINKNNEFVKITSYESYYIEVSILNLGYKKQNINAVITDNFIYDENIEIIKY